MGSEEHQPLNSNEEGEEWEFPSGRELGALLRTKRKETGLTYAQISERIKVRASYLESLENEDWERLPSPTFVKGFIRSYARLLGLSEEGLIALYQEAAPPFQRMPKPIQASPVKKRGTLYLILVFFVLAGGFAVYAWITRSSFMEKPTEQETVLPADDRLDATPADRDTRLKKEEAPPNDTQQPPVVSQETGRELSRGDPAPAPGAEEAGFIDKPADAPQQTEDAASSSEMVKPSESETPVPKLPPASEDAVPPLILKANVKERTWVRVAIDGEKPKEYIFDPESSPEWRAHKGFDLLIGNAGGIDLEFNGKRMENLGKQGQVIKLTLPGSDERSFSTD